MGYWLKNFRDRSTERGSDTEINCGQASWTKGQQDNICSVEINNNYSTASISVGPYQTRWYQFDRYACLVSEGEAESIRTHRVIQFKITKEMVGKYIDFCMLGRKKYLVYVDGNCDTGEGSFGIHSFKIENNFVDMWLGLILPSKNPPYIVLSASKGRLDGNFKQVFK